MESFQASVATGRRRTQKAVREAIAVYQHEDAIIAAALELLRSKLSRRGAVLSSPAAVRDYLQLNLASLEYEVFWCVSSQRIS